ncbi:MAG TPA: glycosyltransferase family 87 protein [Candidatus Polarisedimenticolia bacterium]|nr:glycosyltransferase family 87 protein [Candidatus Polarisedimenticolia bacterium]
MAGLAWFLVLVAAVTGYWVLQPVLSNPLASDFTLVFIAVRIGTEHGWSHIYSLPLQHQLFTELRPGIFFNDGQRFIAPPPLAWVTLLLTGFGAAGAFYAWTVLSVAALGAAWWSGAPGGGLEKAVWLIGAIAWYPVLYALQYGQPALVVLVTVIVCWRLAEGDRPYLAGIALAVGTSLKPQLVLAVPLVLLLGGRWRIAAAWAAAAAGLAVLSLLTLGTTGFNDYRSLLAEAQALPNNRYFTWAYVLGPGALSYVAQAVILMAAAAGAYLNRRGSTGRLLALGILAGAVGATYWHLQDFTILVGAAWLFWRDNPPAWQRIWMAVTALTIELAWPLTPLPLLIATAVWLAFLVYPARKAVAAPA